METPGQSQAIRNRAARSAAKEADRLIRLAQIEQLGTHNTAKPRRSKDAKLSRPRKAIKKPKTKHHED
jgi:hypothetical protein